MTIKITIDSREKYPYTFSDYECITEVSGLPLGDYTLTGFQDKISVERKNLDDLVGCLKGKQRIRFETELKKARSLDRFYVVIESSLSNILLGKYNSNMRAASVIQSILAFSIRYNTHFIFADSRNHAELITYSILSKYFREIEKMMDVCTKSGYF